MDERAVPDFQFVAGNREGWRQQGKYKNAS
jgi:hypothetical protein